MQKTEAAGRRVRHKLAMWQKTNERKREKIYMYSYARIKGLL